MYVYEENEMRGAGKGSDAGRAGGAGGGYAGRGGGGRGRGSGVGGMDGAGMGIRLNLDVTGTAALDPLAVDLPFPRCLFLIRFGTSDSVTRATECLTVQTDVPRFGRTGLRSPNLDAKRLLLMCEPSFKVVP